MLDRVTSSLLIDNNYITPQIDFLSSVILFGILQGVIILTLFYLKKPKGYRFLILFIGAILIQAAESFLWYSGYLFRLPHLTSVSLPFVFLCGPAVLLYTYQIQGKPISLKGHIWHFLPFIAYSLYTGFFYAQPVSRKQYYYLLNVVPDLEMAPPWQPFHADPLQIQGYVFIELMAISLIIYGALGLKNIFSQRDQKGIQSYFSWLIILNSTLVFSGIIMLLAEGGLIENTRIYYPILPHYMTKVYTTLSMYIIVTFLLFNMKLFKAEDTYQRSSLDKDLRTAKLEKILEVFEVDKLHLQQDHCLGLLAKKAKMSENHVSEVLNTELKLSFYDITHRYRIKEARRLLADSDEIKIEHLAEEIGYKSKSAFYNAFKKELSMTPLQYRKSLERQSES